MRCPINAVQPVATNTRCRFRDIERDALPFESGGHGEPNRPCADYEVTIVTDCAAHS
jgi:hypothetical protein